MRIKTCTKDVQLCFYAVVFFFAFYGWPSLDGFFMIVVLRVITVRCDFTDGFSLGKVSFS